MDKWWMVRAGDDNELIPEWVKKSIASIGWPEIGNPEQFKTKNDLIKKCHEIYKDEKPGTRIIWGSQVWRFCREISIGDKVITYDQTTREYLVGTVINNYQFNSNILNDYPNIIGVKWESKRIQRDILSQGAKNSLGAISTIFRVDNWGKEIELNLAGIDLTSSEEDDNDEKQSIEDFIQQSHLWIEDKIDKLDPWDIQELVGGLLTAMGYQVRISPKGADGGIDIIAHKDAFGFQKPIIKVQVKHRKEQSSSPEIQQLLGANPIGESCLFVSTGGFTSSAKKIAKQNNVKLIDLAELVDLICEWYEQLPVEIKAMIPLKKIFVPIV